jgi:hypothetical protein
VGTIADIRETSLNKLYDTVTLDLSDVSAEERGTRVQQYQSNFELAYFPNTFFTILHLSVALKSSHNSVALVRVRTIPTERPPFVDEVSANFCEQTVSRGQRGGSLRP